MSGSPLLIQESGQWKVLGILLGGPAVLGHYEINSIAKYWNDESQIIKIAEEMKLKVEMSIEANLIGLIYKFVMVGVGAPNSIVFPFLKTWYYELMKNLCLHIRSIKGGKKKITEILNHNLVLPLNLYKNILSY